MDRSTLAEDLRYARFIARGAYIGLVKFRDGQTLCPATYVERYASEMPAKTALLFENERIAWGEFNATSNQVGHALRGAGLVPGNVVALIMDNRPEFLATIVGANKVGGCTALINANLTGKQLEHAISIATPSFIVVGAEHVAKLEAIADSLPVPRDRVFVWSDRAVTAAFPGGSSFDDALARASRANPPSTKEQSIDSPFVYIYTSGTTGLPKAAKLKSSRFFKAASIFGWNVLGLTKDDVVYSSGLPLYHSSGTVLGWGGSLTVGAAFALRRKFSARGHWEDCDRWGITVFTYIGELCRYLVNSDPQQKERTHRVRAAIGAGLRPDIWAEFQSRFAIPKIYEFYGATEGNVGIVNIEGRAGMMGRMMPGQCVLAADAASGELLLDASGQARVVSAGECGLLVGQINRVSSFDGYVDRSKNASKVFTNPLGDGKDYFNTGDLVQLHDRGYVAFKDRLGDTFRWKAENVSTNEVQETLNRHRAVAESNVYGVEVPGADGRAGMAAVVAEESFDLVEFASHVRTSLPLYARPIFLRIQREIVTTGTFKHVKTDLRSQGFDPTQVEDDLYFFEEQTRYVPLTKELHERIVSGAIKL